MFTKQINGDLKTRLLCGIVCAAIATLQLMATAVSAQSLRSLTPVTATEVQTRTAKGGGAPTSVKFTNTYGSPVIISWIDYSGNPKPYATLAPNESYVQSTYATHAWLISDKATGIPVEGFVASDQPGEAVIGKLNESAATNAGKSANEKPSNAGGTDSVLIAQTIDALFSKWSSVWVMDRYVPQSSRVTEIQSNQGTYAVRGEFRFLRYGASASIPFAAALKKQDGAFVPINLCYNDTTSGMTDCTNSSTGAATRQVMRVIVLAGVLAALSDSGSSGSANSEATGPDWRARDREEERQKRESRDAEAYRQSNDAFWREMNAPNKY